MKSPWRLVPSAVVIGAATVSLYIWSSRENDDPAREENDALKGKISKLEDRLAEKHLRQAAEQHGAGADTSSQSAEKTDLSAGG